MRKSIIVNLLPVALEESTHQEQERTLRLMEIGDQHLHNLILIARSNDNLAIGRAAIGLRNRGDEAEKPGQEAAGGIQ